MMFPDCSLAEIVSGILVLAAQGGEQIPVQKIHSILYAMRSHEKFLAGLWFSITGAICFSRQIESVLKDLAAQGVLHFEEGSTAVLENVQSLSAHLSRILPQEQYTRLRRASSRFYRKLKGTGGKPLAEQPRAAARNANR